MPSDKVCKTVHQYSKTPLCAEDMKKLQEIAADYGKVKRYVYQRYSGIGGLSKLYPGYTVQNEMTESGLRGELGLPSVYFYLAVFDALGDIKSQWARTKSRVLQLIGRNEGLTEEEKHYLRFLLKVNNAFTAVLNQEPIVLPRELQRKQEELASKVDAEKLHRYLCRQVRKYRVKSRETDKAETEPQASAQPPWGFSVAERAYRYGEKDGSRGIYISTKENRKRVFVPLTDGNQYKRQLYVRLYPQEGHHYGEELGALQTEYAEWVRQQTRSYNRNRADNPGRRKYNARRHRMEERLHSYINQELNRFLRTEKPRKVYIVRMPRPKAGGINRKINHSVAMWQRGYIRSRLEQKCREQSVEIVEVLGKDISNECSSCGAVERGGRKKGIFLCNACGYSAEEKTNTARNVLKRGMEGRVVN